MKSSTILSGFAATLVAVPASFAAPFDHEPGQWKTHSGAGVAHSTDYNSHKSHHSSGAIGPTGGSFSFARQTDAPSLSAREARFSATYGIPIASGSALSPLYSSAESAKPTKSLLGASPSYTAHSFGSSFPAGVAAPTGGYGGGASPSYSIRGGHGPESAGSASPTGYKYKNGFKWSEDNGDDHHHGHHSKSGDAAAATATAGSSDSGSSATDMLTTATSSDGGSSATDVAATANSSDGGSSATDVAATATSSGGGYGATGAAGTVTGY